MINPKPEDIGRKVRLPLFGGKPMEGVIDDISMIVWVKYEGRAYPIATGTGKLEWADNPAPEPAGSTSEDDEGSDGPQLPLDGQ